MSKFYVPHYWTENWGWWEWLRKSLIQWELTTRGDDVMCENGHFSSPKYLYCPYCPDEVLTEGKDIRE